MKLVTVVIILWLSALTFVIVKDKVKDKLDIRKQGVSNVIRPAVK